MSSPAGRWSARTWPTAGCTGSIRASTRRSRSRPQGPYRYGDLRFDAARRRFVAVREEHGRGGRCRSPRSSTSRSTATASRVVLVDGPDFLAAPRHLAGRRPDRLARVGPPGHALGRDAPARRADRGGRHARRVRPRGGRPGGVDRPARVVARRHPPPRQRPERLVEPLPASLDGPRLEPLAPMAAEFADPAWIFDRSSYGFLADGSIVAVAPVATGTTGSSTSCRASTSGEVETPFTELDGLRTAASAVVALAGSPAEATDARDVRPDDARPVRGPAPGDVARDRPGGHLAARDHRLPIDRRPRPRTPSSTAPRTPASSGPTASGRRSWCCRTAGRPRTRRAPSTSGSSC